MLTKDEVDLIIVIYNKYVVPPISLFGFITNIINIIVLRSDKNKSSPNVYLTGLAVADLVFLLFAMIYSLRWYSLVQISFPFYFMYCYSVIIWIFEIASSASVMITVAFTIERFIAVKFPMKRPRYCTVSATKKVILVIWIFCAITLVPRLFENSYKITNVPFDTTSNKSCNRNVTDVELDSSKNFVFVDNSRNSSLNNENCQTVNYYNIELTEFRNHPVYQTISFHLYTLLYSIMPIIILIIFNTYLIVLVRQATIDRKKLMEQGKVKQESVNNPTLRTNFQENKITIVLIAVVVVFIICQLPWAVCLIFFYYKETSSDVQLIINNTLIILVYLNSAVNIFLYSIFSNDYRKTVKRIFKRIFSKERKNLSVQHCRDSTETVITEL